jgi:hypothetical protein
LKPIAAPAGPTQVRLAKGIDVLARRYAVAVDKIESVREHAAKTGRQFRIETEVERSAQDAEVRPASPQLPGASCALAEQAPLQRLLRGRRRRFVGERQCIQIVGGRIAGACGPRRLQDKAPERKSQHGQAHVHSGLKRGRKSRCSQASGTSRQA